MKFQEISRNVVKFQAKSDKKLYFRNPRREGTERLARRQAKVGKGKKKQGKRVAKKYDGKTSGLSKEEKREMKSREYSKS